MLTSTLILPGEDEARTMGWEIKEELDHVVDIVIEAGETPAQPTSVIDWSGSEPEVVRRGAGDRGAVRGLSPAQTDAVPLLRLRWRSASVPRQTA